MPTKRGRKSTAELATAPASLDAARERPPPPDDLTGEQREVWRKTVSALPAGWIAPEHHEILKAYCRHAIRAHDLSERLDAADVSKLGNLGAPMGLETYDKIRRAAESESRAMLAAARALRLTVTSQTRQETAATKRAASSSGRPPWEAETG